MGQAKASSRRLLVLRWCLVALTLGFLLVQKEACVMPWAQRLPPREDQAMSIAVGPNGDQAMSIAGGSSNGTSAAERAAADWEEAAVATSMVEEDAKRAGTTDVVAERQPPGEGLRSTAPPSEEADDDTDGEGPKSGTTSAPAPPTSMPVVHGEPESGDAGHAAGGLGPPEAEPPLLAKGFGLWRKGQKKTWAQTCKPYPGKRVILVQANPQYEDFFRNWVFHAAKLWDAESDQLVVAAESSFGAERLRNLSGLFGVHWDVQFIGSSGEDLKPAAYGTGTWTKVVAHRPAQILQLLRQGCSVYYSDIDMAWVKPVWPAIDATGKYDTYVASDGGAKDRCTCTMYMHPTVANEILMERWINKLKGQSINQRAFNDVLTEMVKAKTINFHVLSSTAFPNGRQCFKNKKPQAIALKKAIVVHANYIQGSGNKRDLLIAAGYWDPCGNKDVDCSMRIREAPATAAPTVDPAVAPTGLTSRPAEIMAA